MTTNDLVSEARKLDAVAYPKPWQRGFGEPSQASPHAVTVHCGFVASPTDDPDAAFIARARALLPQLADALVDMRAEFAATLRVVRQGLDRTDPTYKIATEAIDRLEAPARPMEPTDD